MSLHAYHKGITIIIIDEPTSPLCVCASHLVSHYIQKKQLKDIKIILTILHLRKNIQTEFFYVFDRTTNL